MSFHAFAGAEGGPHGNPGSGAYSGQANDTIIASPGAFPGAYSYCVAPVNGIPIAETYGFRSRLPDFPSFLTVMFMFRFTDTGGEFDDVVSVAELGSASAAGALARRVSLNTSEALLLVDTDGDEIGITGAAYVALDTDYWMLWYVDLREPTMTRDILWVWKAGAWDKAIDVSGHGDGDPADIEAITFGTSVGKGLPTQGGPFYVDEMAVQILNRSPNATPIGSVTTAFKVPSANGTDTDFDSGVPNFQDVDEIPADQVAIDQGDATGEKTSYVINNATGGDTPLALQVIGSGQRTGAAIEIRAYVLETGVGTREYTDGWSQLAGYRILRGASDVAHTYNEINGKTITESTSDASNASFNDLEAGIDCVSIPGGATMDLDQIGLEYMKEGPKALPSDFPATDVATIMPGELGAALGSANPMVF